MAQMLPNPVFPSTNGPVNDIERWENVLFLGGGFTRVGAVTGHWIAIDTTSAERERGWPIVTGGPVRDCISDGQGGFYIGGEFSHVGGYLLPRLAHIQADQSVDFQFNPKPDNIVLTLVLHESMLYVGGYFTRIGGTSRNRLAALNLPNGEVTAWNPDVQRITGSAYIHRLGIHGNRLYAGGSFDLMGEVSRKNLAAFDLDTKQLTDWDPQPNSRLFDLTITGNRLYICGDFEIVEGQTRERVATFDLGTSETLADWAPSVNHTAICIEADNESVYVGGGFHLANRSVERIGIVEFDPQTGAVTPWDLEIKQQDEILRNSSVYAIAFDEDTVYLGGRHTHLIDSANGDNPIPRSYLAAVDRVGGEVLDWSPKLDDAVRTILLDGSSVFTGGQFVMSEDSVERNGLVAIDATTGELLPWDPQATSVEDPSISPNIQSMAFYNDTLYVTGEFYQIGGRDRCVLAALDPVTANAKEWDARYCDPESRSLGQGSVYQLETDELGIYAVGWFYTIGGKYCSGFGRLDHLYGDLITTPTEGGHIASFHSGGPMVVTGQDVYIEDFGNMLWRLDLDLNPVPGWDPDLQLQFTTSEPWEMGLRKLVHASDRLYVMGLFESIDGVARNGVAALDPLNGEVLGWNPQISGDVRTLVADGGIVLLAIERPTEDDRTETELLMVDAQTGDPIPTTQFAPPPVIAGIVVIMGASGQYIGGTFTSVDGAPHQNFAWLGPFAEQQNQTENWLRFQ